MKVTSTQIAPLPKTTTANPQQAQIQKNDSPSIASTFDELKLGERITKTSGKELLMGTFLGSVFGAAIAIPSAGVAQTLLPRHANLAPVVFSGTIGSIAAGLTTDNPLEGAAVGAGTAATIGAVAGAIIGGPKVALVVGAASALGGAVGGSFSSIIRGRTAQPTSRHVGMGMVIMGMGRRH